MHAVHKSLWNKALYSYAFGLSLAVALLSCGEPGSAVAADDQSEEEISVTHEPNAKPAKTNRLANATSPYLLQHAHNPVDWYEWSDEALQRAKDEDRPIFLSIGYSACHWCHVMAHESFEDESVAAILNANFVNIKVDREERPDIDEIYMTAVQVMTGSGGWPLSVFLTPDLEPFYGGTYFPPEDRYGRSGFKTVLASLIQAWEERRDDVARSAEQLTAHIRETTATAAGTPSAVEFQVLQRAAKELRGTFDADHGGWGGAPKFPSSAGIALLLRQHHHTGEQDLLDMAAFTLKKMFYGGMYDHLGGGFHRYSVDARWLVPHFEKMLYDNAQLSQVYLEAYQVTGDPLFRRVAEETFDYVLRDMRDPAGAFYSSEDADSEGEEGKFYIWTQEEILSLLGEAEGELFCQYYDIRADGNFESHEPYHGGLNILHIPLPPVRVAKDSGLDVAALERKMKDLRDVLINARNKRVRPGRDDKILTSWNALMIGSLARAYQTLDEERYLKAAESAATFILEEMMEDGVLLRSHRAGESRLPAYLDDYAFMTSALLDLYEATFDLKWLTAADQLAQSMTREFWDDAANGFFFTTDRHRHLIARTKPAYDGAEPSGNSMAALALLRLAKLTGNERYFDKAEAVLSTFADNMLRAPRASLNMLCAADFYLNPPREIAIVGPVETDSVTAFLHAVRRPFLPNKVVALVDPSAPGADAVGERVPLLADKELVGGQAAVYVCQNFACKRPVTDAEELPEVLGTAKKKE
jgi:uncharacterized protein